MADLVRLWVYIKDELAVENCIAQGLIGPLPVRKVQGFNFEISLFAVDLRVSEDISSVDCGG